jgi:hypothetical protein
MNWYTLKYVKCIFSVKYHEIRRYGFLRTGRNYDERWIELKEGGFC